MIFSQIGLLIATLKWLIGLVSLSFVLLLVGLICLIMSSEPVASTEPQIIDYPIQTVKSIAVLTPALKKGKLLFATNCETCHEISVARVVGPGLLGVAERVPDRAWLIKWIKNPSAVLKSGDVYANHMVKAFAPVLMPGFPTLTEKEVKDLIDYIASYKSEETNFVR